MGFKVFKKVTALLLIVLLCISALPVFGLTYSGGPIEYELDRSYFLEAENAEIANGKLSFDKNGRMKFDLLLPFDAVTLEFSYETVEESVNFAIKTDENSYKTVFKENSSASSIAIHELCKSNTITFTADKPVVVTGVKFIKVNEQYNEVTTTVVPYSKYEEAILTLVALKANVGAVKTRGTLLRWDNENIYLAPKNIDGSIYVPLKKFAESMGYYCEDYQDLSYVYLLGETESLTLKNGKGYYEGNHKGKQDLEINIIYKDGYTWAPVRKIAELFGFTVDYKDGYVLIGDRLRVKNVIKNKTYFTTLREEMEVYSVPDKKTVGKTYHVAQTKAASDANDGTEKFPFATIQKAADVAKAGDTVIVHEGTYRETVTPKNDGTVFAPITFCAAKGEKVTISALEPISGFIKYKGDIMCAPVHNDLGFGINQLFYKGDALLGGRHPNEDTKPNYPDYPEYVPKGVYPTRGNIRITEKGGNIAYSDTDLDQEDNYWKGGSFISLKGEGWCMVGGEIVSSTKGKLELKDYDGTKSYNLGIDLPEGGDYKYYTEVHDSDYGYITNHINTLDLPGEWFMKDNVMYVIPPAGADLASDFEIKDRMRTIDLRDRKYVTVRGIDTIGGGIAMSGDEAEGLVLDDGEFRHIAHHTVLYDQSNYNLHPDIPRGSLESVKAGEVGICIDGKYNTIVNCTIDYSSGTGITLLGKYHYVNNNVISNTSISGGYPGGIWINTDEENIKSEGSPIFGGHYITSNTIYNGVRGVFEMFSVNTGSGYYPFSACEVAYNRFFNGALASRDTGITYEYGNVGGTDILKTRMHHNFVYNVGHVDEETSYMVFPLYHDGYVSARDTYSNLVYYQDKDLPYTENEGIWVASSSYTVVRDRNNSDLGYRPEGEFELTKVDYPGARQFLPGADHGQFARKYMNNYDDFVNKTGVYFASKETVDEKGKETFVFENVKLEKENATHLYFYMDREYGRNSAFSVVAKIYDEKGNLVKKAEMGNNAWSGRFYVEEIHRGLVILDKIEEGTYRVELEIPDPYTNIFYLTVDPLDTTYDQLYTKEMEESGVVAYPIVSTSLNEDETKETFRFENVKIEDNINTRINLHGTREYNKPLKVNVTTNVFDKTGELVSSTTLTNVFNHTKVNQYEVLNGTVIVPKLPDGEYDIEFEFADTYSELIRIMTEEADESFDYLYNNPYMILGGTYDDWIEGAGELALSAEIEYTPENLQTYEYFPAANCWEHTVIYKDREIPKDVNLLKITMSTGQPYDGSVVRLYVDSMETEPIATWTSQDTGWARKTSEIPLDRVLTAGNHTLYFDFEGEGLCSSIWNFTFDFKK